MNKVLTMHRATDKMGMAVKRAMEQCPDATDWDRETLLARVNGAVEHQRWVEAEMFMAVLWFKEWTEFLGRDFTVDGADPEHAPVPVMVDGVSKVAKVIRRAQAAVMGRAGRSAVAAGAVMTISVEVAEKMVRMLG